MTGLVLALAWIAGVAAGLLSTDASWGPPLLGGAALVAAWIAGPGNARLLALALAIGLFGLTHARVALSDAAPDPLAGLSGEVSLVGRVADATILQGSRVAFPIVVSRVERPGSAREVEASSRATVLVRAPIADVEYGDLVAVHGRLTAPRSRPGYPEADLLARRGINHVIDFAGVVLLEKGQAGARVQLGRLRSTLEGGLRSSLPEPHASLTAGIVLGARSSTPPELRSALVATGTSHIVAVSGFNVLVVAGALGYIVIRLIGRPWALAPMLLIVWAYTLLVGAPPSGIRAALMVSLAFMAQAVGRLPDPITTLTLTAAAIVGWDPRLLLDVGFQLSVAATAGLILMAGPLAERLLALPRCIREPLAATIAAQVAALPIILGTFHTLSLVTPVANVLVTPVLPLVMLFGGLLSALAPLPGVGELLAWATWGLVSWLLVAIEWSASLPNAVLYTGRLPSWFTFAWYGSLALWAAAGSADVRTVIGHRPALRVALGVAVALVPATAVLAAPSGHTATISVLDVGEPAAFVRTASGRTALLGGARSPSQLAASVAERLTLWERGLDVVVASRPTDSQRAALAETLRRYPARLVLGVTSSDGEPSQPTQSRGGGGDLLSASTLQVGQAIDLDGGARVEVVDVRIFQDLPAVDLLVHVGDVAVWLPSAGPPSPRWQETAVADRRVVLRLPGGAEGWIRAAPNAPWLAIILDTPPRLALRDLGTAPILDQRTYGDIDVVVDGDGVYLRSARCPGGTQCPVTPLPSADGSEEP